jgi:hypothetical protein
MLDNLRSLSRTTKNLRKALLISLLALTFLTACEPDTAIYITMKEEMPPQFSFSGPWWAVDFRVAEMPPKETYSREKPLVNPKTLWKISTTNGLLRAKNWPEVTYGVVPEGFVQKTPARGSPPPLVEGKIYAAQALDTSESGGSCFFMIRDGKPVVASESDLFKEKPAANGNKQSPTPK